MRQAPEPASGVGDAPEPIEAAGVWGREVDRALAWMTDTITTALAEHERGDIDVLELQRRCVAAGAVRVGDLVLLWDWVNGKVFAYDGFQLVDVTEIPA